MEASGRWQKFTGVGYAKVWMVLVLENCVNLPNLLKFPPPNILVIWHTHCTHTLSYVYKHCSASIVWRSQPPREMAVWSIAYTATGI